MKSRNKNVEESKEEETSPDRTEDLLNGYGPHTDCRYPATTNHLWILDRKEENDKNHTNGTDPPLPDEQDNDSSPSQAITVPISNAGPPKQQRNKKKRKKKSIVKRVLKWLFYV